MTLFRGKFRAETRRLPGWNYAGAGYYFVTICTRDRACWLGDVVDGVVRLSAVGKVAEQFWRDIPAHVPGISLDEFVVMPNHVHGIVVIADDLDACRDVARRDVACYVSTEPDKSDKPPDLDNISTDQRMSAISPEPGSLGTVIRSFKSAVTAWCRKNGHDFAWQPRFYDQIVGDERTLAAIRQYIQDNPMQWAMDRENPVVHNRKSPLVETW